MARLEQIIDEARPLSPAEKRKLRQALDHEFDQPSPSQSRATESAWVDEHRDEYLGQWVAVEGEKPVAHGTNPRQVYLSARESGISVPFIVRVQKREEPFMGGWRDLRFQL